MRANDCKIIIVIIAIMKFSRALRLLKSHLNNS